MKGFLAFVFFILLIVVIALGIYNFTNTNGTSNNTTPKPIQLLEEEQVPDTVVDVLDKPEETTETTINKFNNNLNSKIVDSVFDKIATNPNLSVFSELIIASELKDYIDSDENIITVFAPTNSAFELISSTYKDLLKVERFNDLVKVIRNHYVKGKIDAQTLSNQLTLDTDGGDGLIVSGLKGKLAVNNIEVIEIEIEGRNGYVYIINDVILPKEIR